MMDCKFFWHADIYSLDNDSLWGGSVEYSMVQVEIPFKIMIDQKTQKDKRVQWNKDCSIEEFMESEFIGKKKIYQITHEKC